MTIRPVSKRPLFDPNAEDDRPAWVCSVCEQRISHPAHECKEMGE